MKCSTLEEQEEGPHLDEELTVHALLSVLPQPRYYPHYYYLNVWLRRNLRGPPTAGDIKTVVWASISRDSKLREIKQEDSQLIIHHLKYHNDFLPFNFFSLPTPNPKFIFDFFPLLFRISIVLIRAQKSTKPTFAQECSMTARERKYDRQLNIKHARNLGQRRRHSFTKRT